MEHNKLIGAANDELNLVLSFFSRVESRSSVVLAIDTGMVGFLMSSAPPLRSFSFWMTLSTLATMALLALSICFLYKGSAPNLKGGEQSLVYFAEIAKLREHTFIEKFSTQNEKEYGQDLLGQAWRNAKIVTVKFYCLKWAFRFMAFAIIPWFLALILFANNGTHTTLFKP